MNAMTAPPVTIDQRVAQYVALRDKIKELDDAFKEQLKPYKATLEALNGVLLNHLKTVGVESARTDSGTVYRTDKASASIADEAAFWSFVVATGNFDLIDKRANKTAVADFIAARTEAAKLDPTIVPGPPPGVNYTITHVVGVRRS